MIWEGVLGSGQILHALGLSHCNGSEGRKKLKSGCQKREKKVQGKLKQDIREK